MIPRPHPLPGMKLPSRQLLSLPRRTRPSYQTRQYLSGGRCLHTSTPRAITAASSSSSHLFSTPRTTPSPRDPNSPSTAHLPNRPQWRRCFATSTSPSTSTTPTSPPSSSSSSSAEIEATITYLTDLYSTARDEFEIAAEETTKNSTYAADDRLAAREALDELVKVFKEATAETKGEGGEEVRKRVGSRVRELERAVANLEELAVEAH